MKRAFTISFIFIISTIGLFSNTLAANASDGYPKPLDERKLEKMGSILNGEGIIFRPGKISKQTPKTTVGKTYETTRYLWPAAIEIMANVPLTSVDNTTGFIITDWYSAGSDPSINHKVNIFIRENAPNAEALEIRVFTRVLKNNNWLQVKQEKQEAKLKTFLEKQILERAEMLQEKAGKK